MSYNVSMWKTKLIGNLRIPVAALYEGGEDWQPNREEMEGGKTRFDWDGDANYVIGRVEEGWLIVEGLCFRGVCSGSVLRDVIEPALKQSTGGVVASRVWEGGDLIDLLIVCDGNLHTEAIEL